MTPPRIAPMTYPAPALELARTVRVLCLDVDGVLTDGKLIYTEANTESKAFHVQDGAAIKMLQSTGVAVAIITGRRSASVERRASELGIRHIHQAVADKSAVVDAIAADESAAVTEFAHVGDDIADLTLFRAVGFRVSVPGAHPEVARHADYVTQTAPGAGAVREVCHLIMLAQNTWSDALARELGPEPEQRR